VAAVALAGSRTDDTTDIHSDIDLYVYADDLIPVQIRTAIMRRFTDHGEVGNEFWEPGDEWIDAKTGVAVDLIYRMPQWIETELDRVLVQHRASIGYSTCLWYNVLTSVPLHDPRGWYGRLHGLNPIDQTTR
jgi:hypothetical protein